LLEVNVGESSVGPSIGETMSRANMANGIFEELPSTHGEWFKN